MESRKPYLATLPGLILGCLVCCALWGSAFPCIKIGYGLWHPSTRQRLAVVLRRSALHPCRHVGHYRHERSPAPTARSASA